MTDQPDTTAIRASVSGRCDAVAENLVDVCDALDAARTAWGNGECCCDCPHHGFTVTELDGRDPKELTWEETFALLHARAEAAEACINNALAMVDGHGDLVRIRRALTEGTGQ